MKRLFARRKSSQFPASQVTPVVAPLPTPQSTSLKPKFVVPPLPHPCPYASIHVLVTAEGLVLRPDVDSSIHTESHVKVSWGRDFTVKEIGGDIADWTAGASVYGIVGILRLFHASYLLVITSRTDVGNLFSDFRTVYRVDGVHAIPLIAERATAVINMLASRNTTNISVLPPVADSMDSEAENTEPRGQGTESGTQDLNQEVPRSPHVTFAPQVHRPTSAFLESNEYDNPTPPSPTSSGYSTPNSSLPSSPVAKALAAQLSFWSRLSKRIPDTPSSEPESTLDERPSSPFTMDSIERRMEGGDEPSEVLNSILAVTAPPPSTSEEKHSELDNKIIRETIKEFVKGGMYFSYNFDITTSLQRKQQQVTLLEQKSTLLSDLDALDEQPQVSLPNDSTDTLPEPQATLPLWRRIDRKFWWNESLLRPFIDAGLHSYVLPIMQGYYQIASFCIPPTGSSALVPASAQLSVSEDGTNEGDDEESTHYLIDYILISRRSRDRAGLRYQRRGIDDEANVANFVETETIMRIKREGRSSVFSHVQIRGSIPLFWTQSGYGLKPPPQLSTERTQDQSMDALSRHLKRIASTYGPIAVVNLAEQHGKEGVITAAFRESMDRLDLKDARYYEYDFHAETKGMQYENISKLISRLERTFESQGFFWVCNGMVMSRQKGVFRVNCIDCLDRTNVVQSAFARYALHNQLEAVAVLNTNESGDRSEAGVIFNDVWANNGDAISRAYAGTSALKGDFTRTGKRDLGGLINDGLNSLSRAYTSTFGDWFSQAVIDFLLGNRTLSVFSEFLLKLSSTDPRELIRVSKIRAAAIETCALRVLSEGERQIGGWTLFSPVELNTKIGGKFEEKVLLLTTKALYIVSYDYSLEKVKLFTRIPLGDITCIRRGAYILSPLEEASRNAADNYGFVISYLPSRMTTRVTSYSVHNTVNSIHTSTTRTSPRTPRLSRISSPRQPSRRSTSLSKILSNATFGADHVVLTAAFKMLPIDQAARVPADVEDPVASASTCRDAVGVIVEMIRKACADVGSGTHPEFVLEKDIVSLADAQQMTTMYAKLEYNFKRLLWLGS